MGRNEMTDKESRLLNLIKSKGVEKKTDGFILASGKRTNLYIDLRKVNLDPEGINLVGEIMLKKIHELAPEATHVGGLETGSIPISTAVTLLSKRASPLAGFWVRKQTKDHGLKNLIEGNLTRSAYAVIVDDVVTTGGSSLQAVRAVREFGAKVVQVVAIVDRGAVENFKKEGIPYFAFFEENDISN
jgi:orotate phosphoribosyltransferase